MGGRRAGLPRSRAGLDRLVGSLIGFIAAGLAICGIGYDAIVLWAACGFVARRRKATTAAVLPPVSLLKPLYGADPQGYESLKSYCTQDYPSFEILFGVGDPADKSVQLVRRLLREFPELPARLIVCPLKLGHNLKVSTLVQMLPEARHSHLLISDSDIRADPDYLRCVMSAFVDPRVGLVTCLYRGVFARTLGSRLEALAITTNFAGGVLAAEKIEKGIHFGLGSTLAFSRDALERIGGLEPLLDYLADDFEIGCRIASSGRTAVLSTVVVDHYLPDYSFPDFVRHQLRWSRSTRDSRPGGYAGLLFTFGLFWSCLAALSLGSRAGWGLFLAAAAVRVAAAFTLCAGVLRDRRVLRQLWLLPLSDLMAVVIWLGGYTGRIVFWRGRKFVLERGRIRAVENS